MIELSITRIQYLFTKVREENTKTLKLKLLSDAIREHEDVSFILNLMANKMMRSIKPRYNTINSVGLMGDIIEAFNGVDTNTLPYVSQKIIAVINEPKLIGLTFNDINYIIYANKKEMNVYPYFTTAVHSKPRCKICGDSLDKSKDLCNHCLNIIQDFIDYRSEDTFTTQLQYENYDRVNLLKQGYSEFVVGHYDIEYDNGRLTFTRNSSIYDAKLPIKEFQRKLID
jgi:hypothetical protein